MNRIIALAVAAVVFVIAFALVFVLGSRKARFESVSPEAFSSLLAEDADAQLVDVRTAEEYAESHLPGAVNIDVKQDDFLAKAHSQLASGRTVFVYCRSGRRSKDAAAQLAKVGYKVVDMNGGILEWAQKGLETTQE